MIKQNLLNTFKLCFRNYVKILRKKENKPVFTTSSLGIKIVRFSAFEEPRVNTAPGRCWRFTLFVGDFFEPIVLCKNPEITLNFTKSVLF